MPRNSRMNPKDISFLFSYMLNLEFMSTYLQFESTNPKWLSFTSISLENFLYPPSLGHTPLEVITPSTSYIKIELYTSTSKTDKRNIEALIPRIHNVVSHGNRA